MSSLRRPKTLEIENPPAPPVAQPKAIRPPPPEPPLIATAVDDQPEPGDVWQVTDMDSPFFAVMITVGAIADGELHGYWTAPNKRKEFATVPIGACKRIGVAFVKTRKPCSDEWVKQHEQGNAG